MSATDGIVTSLIIISLGNYRENFAQTNTYNVKGKNFYHFIYAKVFSLQ